MLRGNEGKKIFLRNKERKQFIEILSMVNKKYNCIIYAFCLMSNHIHLIIDDNGNDISIIVKSIATRYAMYFNKVYNRKGHLFQDRFRSEIIEDDNYLLRASRYIHNNPVKAGMVSCVADYAWSSYLDYLGKTTPNAGVVDPEKVLKIISSNRETAIKEYIHFVTQSADAENEIFIDIEEEKTTAADKNTEYIQTLKDADRKISELSIIRNLDRNELLLNKKERDEVIREIRKNSSLSQKAIGSLFGLSESAVCKILNR